MEILEPKKKRSPIESLKFQRKSDYKKFRNFIKKETKELKGITRPKEDKLKSILKVSAVGLGIAGLAGIITKGLAAKEGDDFERTFQPGVYGIGRRNFEFKNQPQRTTPDLTPDPRARKFTPTIKKITTGANITRPSKALIPEVKEVELRKEKNIKARKITKAFSDVKKSYALKGGLGTKNLAINVPKDLNTKNIEKTKRFQIQKKLFKNFDTGIKAMDEAVDALAEADAARDALADIKEGGKFGNITEDVSSRAKDVKSRKLAMDDAFRDMNIENAKDDLLKKIFNQEEGKKFKNTRPFKNIFSSKTYGNYDPQGRITSTISANPYKGKSIFSKFTRKLLRGNKKITSDTFKGLSYKGPKFSLISNLTANPVVKAGLFFLDAYAAYSSGKQVINFKDNIGTALYDLGVSINNEIFKDDPSKLMLYRSESSNENIRVKQVLRNQKIKELKEQANNQSGNNVIVVPENKQENQVNSTIPIKKGGTEVSFVPFEPLNNIGTDILLHKLNQ